MMTVGELREKLAFSVPKLQPQQFPDEMEIEVYCDDKDLLFTVSGVEENEGRLLITVDPAPGN